MKSSLITSWWVTYFSNSSYRVTYKSYSVPTELMIIMPTKLKLTYSWRAHINLHKGTESNSNRPCLESLISAALENIYVAHSWWVHKSLQGTTESNSNRLCLESLIYVAPLKTFMLPLRPFWIIHGYSLGIEKNSKQIMSWEFDRRLQSLGNTHVPVQTFSLKPGAWSRTPGSLRNS